MASVTKFVSTATAVQIDTSDEPWTGLSNLFADDAAYAESTSSSTDPHTEAIKATMSGNEFAIPSGSSIDGVQVEYSAKADDGGSEVWDERYVQLNVDGDRTGLDFGNTGHDISPTEAVFTIGGDRNVWGVPLTVDAVNASSFGVWLRWKRQGGSVKVLQVNYIKITVYYTDGGGDIAYDSNGDVAVGRMTPLHNQGDNTTYRIRFPGLGTPKAAIIIVSQVIHNADSQYDSTSRPFDEGQNARNYICVTDGVNTNTVQNEQDSTADRGHFSDQTVYGPTIGGNIHFSAFGPDYIELETISSHEDRPQLMAIAFAGSSVQAHEGFQAPLDGTTNETSDVTGPGFEPDIVFFPSGLETETTGHSVYAGFGFGVVHNPGTGDANVVQKHFLIEQRYKDNSVSDTFLADIENTMRVSTDRCHSHINYGRDPKHEYWWTVGDFDANGFTITGHGDDATGSDADDGSAYLALKMPGDVAVGIFDTPTATGAKTFGDADFAPNIGFTPQFMLSLWGKADVVDTNFEDSPKGDTASFHAADRHRVNGSAGYSNQNGAGTKNPIDYIASDIYVGDGDQTTLFDGTFDGFTSGGYDATFSTVDATARKGIFIATAPSSNIPVSASASLASTASVTAVASTLRPSSASLSAQASVTAVGSTASVVTVTSSLAGTATQSASADIERSATAALDAQATQSAQAGVERPVSAALAGTATESAAAQVERPAASALAGEATLAAAATTATGLTAAATLTGEATQSAQAGVERPVSAALAGEATESAAADVERSANAALAAQGAVTAAAQVEAVAEITGRATLAGTATESAAGSVERPVSAALAAAATESAASSVERPVSAALAGTATQSVQGRIDRLASAALAGEATESAQADVEYRASAALAGTATLTATAAGGVPGAAALAAQAQLTAAPTVERQGTAALVAQAQLTAAADVQAAAINASAALAGEATAQARAAREAPASSVLTAQATLAARGDALSPYEVVLSAQAGISAAPVCDRALRVRLDAVAGLSTDFRVLAIPANAVRVHVDEEHGTINIDDRRTTVKVLQEPYNLVI